jgi:AraC-like DNA-binding protein
MLPVILNVLTLAVALTLVFILNILPAKTGDRNRYLLVLLGLLIAYLVFGLLVLTEVMSLSIYAVLSLSIAVLYGPVFYFYIRKFYKRSTSLFAVHLLVIELVLWTMILLQVYRIVAVPTWFYNLYYITLLVGYFIAILRLRRTYPLKRSQGWMKTIALGFAGLILLYGIESVWMSLDFDSVNEIVQKSITVHNIFSILFLLITIRQIITAPEAFSNMKIRIPYKKSNSDDFGSELNMISEFVRDQKAYKNPDLTRELIGRTTGISVHRISEIINCAFEKNFNDWVNDQRIEEAYKLLEDSDLSIKEVCYEIGFNSKSAFNSAFKRRCGKTPTDYRKHRV